MQTKELNILKNEEVNLIQKKKQHIKFISKEIHYKRIEENILQKKVQTTIEKIKNQIETKLSWSSSDDSIEVWLDDSDCDSVKKIFCHL